MWEFLVSSIPLTISIELLRDKCNQGHDLNDQDVEFGLESDSGGDSSGALMYLCLHSSILRNRFSLSWPIGVTLIKSLMKQG
jgi:hypothetical protein